MVADTIKTNNNTNIDYEKKMTQTTMLKRTKQLIRQQRQVQTTLQTQTNINKAQRKTQVMIRKKPGRGKEEK